LWRDHSDILNYTIINFTVSVIYDNAFVLTNEEYTLKFPNRKPIEVALSTFCSWCNLSSLGNTSSILGNLQKRFYFLYRLNAWLISQEEMCINYAWNKSYSCSVSINFNCINCVKLCRLTLNVENYGFQPWSGQTIDDSIGICCFSLNHAALRSKSNDCCDPTRAGTHNFPRSRSVCKALHNWCS
jgi:hypothetical protein